MLEIPSELVKILNKSFLIRISIKGRRTNTTKVVELTFYWNGQKKVYSTGWWGGNKKTN